MDYKYKREEYWIEQYDAINKGYNMARNDVYKPKANRQDAERAIEMLKDSSIPMTEIAKELNVSHSWVSLLNQGKVWHDEKYEYPIREVKVHKNTSEKYCCDCGKRITKCSTRCPECSLIYTNQKAFEGSLLFQNNITREELKDMIRTMPFTEVGKKYNVTDNGVRRWCKRYNLPYRKKDINEISDAEWEKI